MGVRAQRLPKGVPDDGTEVTDSTNDLEVFETHYDGQTFAWGPGQHRNFIDEGVGIGHASNLGNPSVVFETGLFSANGESRY